jgi:tetrahydrodipicolinate N-succinyltransferase
VPVVDTSASTAHPEDQQPISVGSAVQVGARTVLVLQADGE